MSTLGLGAILSVARGVLSGCADRLLPAGLSTLGDGLGAKDRGLLSIRSNTDPRLGALGAGGALARGDGAIFIGRLGTLGADGAFRKTGADGAFRKTGADGRLSMRGPTDG